MYNDILWLRQMCKMARTADEYKQIKKFIKSTDIKMDYMCYAYITNSYSGNKIKDEIIKMFDGII